ncbi:hypothetical protein [Exiguobacterium aurantiacum]|uniref:hypothetical protein n=1 Tax=Exiguobacterium aurantiacum TaxID=33987 RepID=UPI00384FE167
MKKKRVWILTSIFLLVVASFIFGEDDSATKEVATKSSETKEVEATEPKEKEEKEVEEEPETVVAEEEDKDKEKVSDTSTVLGQIQTRPLMNGAGTERIGDYAFIASDKGFVTEENLIKFFKDDISKVEDANFLVVDLNDGSSLHITGGMPLVTYGQFDKEDQSVSQQWETIIVDVENGTVTGTLHEGVAAEKALFAQ